MVLPVVTINILLTGMPLFASAASVSQTRVHSSSISSLSMTHKIFQSVSANGTAKVKKNITELTRLPVVSLALPDSTIKRLQVAQAILSSVPLPMEHPNDQENSLFPRDDSTLTDLTGVAPSWRDMLNEDLTHCTGKKVSKGSVTVCTFTESNGNGTSNQTVFMQQMTMP